MQVEGHEDGHEEGVAGVYVVPGNFYRVDVPRRVLEDEAALEAYVEALMRERNRKAWHEQTIPAWVALALVVLLALVVVAATVREVIG